MSDGGGRKLKLKTEELETPIKSAIESAKRSRWNELFGQRSPAPVEEAPDGRAIPQPALRKASLPVLDDENTRTQAMPHLRDVTSASQLRQQSVLRPKISRQTREREFDERQSRARGPESSGRRRIALGLAGLALLSATWWIQTPSTSPATGAPAAPTRVPDPVASRERVEYYRMSTGQRINRERINTELQNLRLSPIEPGARRVVPRDIMQDLPLQGEANPYRGSRDRVLAENPTYPDARVRYGLQEEQDFKEWSRRAQSLWKEDFINNAAHEGVRLQLLPDGSVEVDSRPIPLHLRPYFNESTGEWVQPKESR